MASDLAQLPALKGVREEVKALERLKRTGYRIIGRHSAVKVCHWTKEALRNGRHCYKRWYGIESHRCIQMTPSVQFCNLMCRFCWRFHTINRVEAYSGMWDKPEEIVEAMIREQRQLLSGFKGNPRVRREMFEEAMKPKHVAISLDGEPATYPYLADLIKIIKQRGMTAFLVTNGTYPERLRELLERDSEPTNLYISLYGPDKETHVKTCNPLIRDSWEKLMESLKLMRRFKCRKVIRLTLVKGYTMKDPEKYAELIRVAGPDFVECKGYMHVGESQKRLPRTAMPSMEEIREFADRLRRLLGFVHVVDDEASRVSLLADPESEHYRRDYERIMGRPPI